MLLMYEHTRSPWNPPGKPEQVQFFPAPQIREPRLLVPHAAEVDTEIQFLKIYERHTVKPTSGSSVAYAGGAGLV